MSGLYPAEKNSTAPPSYGEAAYNLQPSSIPNPVYSPIIYGELPVQCTCPYCKQMIITRTEKKSGILPWLICGGVFLIGGVFGCCLIPFCIDDIKDTEHYCPSCGILLGVRKTL